MVDAPDPEPGPGEALLQVRVAGICRTDLELARGYMGFTGIPGHEFVGKVQSVLGPADSVLIGARVAGEINIGCQECRLCAGGLARHCPRRRVLGILGKDGAFAERLTLPISNLRVVPDTLSDEQAVFVEPLAAAFEILDQIGAGRGVRLLVLGDGKLGLLAAQALAANGCQVTVAGRHASKLEIARNLGLAVLEGPEKAIGRGFDVVVEATGTPGGLDMALSCVRPRGTIVMKSTCATRSGFDASRAVVDEITLVGSRCGRFEPAIEAIRSGSVKVEDLIAAQMPLEDGVAAFQRAGESGVLKVLLRIAS